MPYISLLTLLLALYIITHFAAWQAPELLHF